MPTRLCLESKCGRPGTVRGRCPEHATQQRRSQRSNQNTFYASPGWRNDRRAYLRDHPICEKCGNALSLIVHHIIPIEDGGPKRPGPNGLRALCSPCHTSLHRTMGKDTA